MSKSEDVEKKNEPDVKKDIIEVQKSEIIEILKTLEGLKRKFQAKLK